MFIIKISKEILEDMLRECEKSGDDYGEMDVNPITFYQKNDDAFNPVVGITLSDSGEISTKIHTKYRPDKTNESSKPEDKVVEEAISSLNEITKKYVINTFKSWDKKHQAELLKELNRELAAAEDLLSKSNE